MNSNLNRKPVLAVPSIPMLGFALLLSAPVSAQFGDPVWTYESDQVEARLGSELSSAGDVNGDGYSDILVGAHRLSAGELGEGKVFLFHGSPSGISTTPNWTAEGDQIGAAFGHSLSGVGDVNGDGFDDVLVGAYGMDGDQVDEGRVFMYLGSPSGLAPLPSWTVDGDQVGAGLGYSVCGAGDVNGDGFQDVALGVWAYDGLFVDAGRVLVFHGSLTGLSASPDRVLAGNQLDGRFGTTVERAMDVQGDGFDDLLVGSVFHDGAIVDGGSVWLYSGSEVGLETTPGWSWEGTQLDGRFGQAVAGVGDINGDGYAEVAVGAPRESNELPNVGSVRLYYGSASGPSGVADLALWGEQEGGEFGQDVAFLGDLDENGYAEFAVGAHLHDTDEQDAGRISVLYGDADGPTADHIDGTLPGAALGFKLAGAGDFDGDGRSDILVSEHLASLGQSREGRVLVYRGAPLDLLDLEILERFGGPITRLYRAGDVDGDGFDDMLVWSAGISETNSLVSLYLGGVGGPDEEPDWSAMAVPTNLGSEAAAANGAGDLNGDGYDDVAVSNRRFELELYFGSSSGLAIEPSMTLPRVAADGCGDVNGDGFSDLLVRESEDSDWWVHLGSASGLSEAPIMRIGFIPFRRNSAWLGDANADGFEDFIVGRHQLVLGGPMRPSLVRFEGGGMGPFARVELAGDVNNDGTTDVLVTAADRDGVFGDDEGFTSLFLGPVSGQRVAAWTHLGATRDARLGLDAMFLGDLNRDGNDDYAILNDDNFATLDFYLSSGVGPEPPNAISTLPLPDDGGFNEIVSLGDLDGNGTNDFGMDFVGDFQIVLVQSSHRAGRVSQWVGSSARRLSHFGRTGLLGGVQVRIPVARSILGGRTSPLGRTHVAVEVEVKPIGMPFDATGILASAFTDTGQISSDLALDLPSMAAGTYHWRARLTYQDPVLPHGPWFSLPGFPRNGSHFRVSDCDGNGVEDAVDVRNGAPDCNGNQVPDSCELDCDADGIMDLCQGDCDDDAVSDGCAIASGLSPDCNLNGVPDECELSSGAVGDCDENGVPDDCQPDCNGDGSPDICDVDCDEDGTPDVCDAELDCSPGEPFCFGSGCPCLNDDPLGGCINSSGSGGRLDASGSSSLAINQLVLTATSLPPNNSAIYFASSQTLSSPALIGDGLACVGGSTTFRFLPGQVSAGGVFTLDSVVLLAPLGFIVPGATRHFQVWTRDVLCGPPPAPCASSCGSNSNLTNAYTITFAP